MEMVTLHWPMALTPERVLLHLGRFVFEQFVLARAVYRGKTQISGAGSIFLVHVQVLPAPRKFNYMRVSENRGPEYSTLNSRMLIIKTPKLIS